MQFGKNSMSDKFDADIIKAPNLGHMKLDGKWKVECHDEHGQLKWVDYIENIIVNAGLDHSLDVTLSGGSQTATWYVGLASSSPTVNAADTMASHGGWTEVTAYSEANRQTYTDAGVSGQSLTNSASKATFSINGTVTVGGAFLTSNNTKSGTTGTLFAVGAFSGGNRSVVSGDTLQVTATFSAADDGV